MQPQVRAAIITGNEFYSKARIVNQARGRVILKDNIEQTEEDPFPDSAMPVVKPAEPAIKQKTVKQKTVKQKNKKGS